MLVFSAQLAEQGLARQLARLRGLGRIVEGVGRALPRAGRVCNLRGGRAQVNRLLADEEALAYGGQPRRVVPLWIYDVCRVARFEQPDVVVEQNWLQVANFARAFLIGINPNPPPNDRDPVLEPQNSAQENLDLQGALENPNPLPNGGFFAEEMNAFE